MDGVRTADATFEIGLDQRIRDWSPEAAAVLGYTAEEVEGKSCYDIIGGVNGADERLCKRGCPIVANSRQSETTPNFDTRSRRSDGRPIWLNVSILVEGSGTTKDPTRVTHLLRDITQRQRLEGKARRALAILSEDEGEGAQRPGGGTSSAEHGSEGAPTTQLSLRETEVLRLLAEGIPTQEIADRLGVTRVTTRNHIAHILTKLGVQSRLQAVVRASEKNLI